jgi:hypothetical protein
VPRRTHHCCVHPPTISGRRAAVAHGTYDSLTVELINEHGLASVSAHDARYAGTVGRGPWVASITIARIDKPGGISG